MMNQINNPGLEKFDISDYKGSSGVNFYEQDKILQRMVDRYSAYFTPDHRKDMHNHLSGYGKLLGGILNDLTLASHKEGKYGEIRKYDSVGNRIDEIIYSEEQLQSRKISYDYGVVNLDFHKSWNHSFPYIHRYALAYLMNLNGEGGVSCPLAMTDGLITALKQIGTDEQRNKYLPLIAGEGSSSHFMCGQYVTERVGGSNVGANRTIAIKQENGKWKLIGEKWFCSNPGDLWVTTAKMEGTNTIGMFLVSRYKEDGSLNEHHIIRKKDIIGSRGKLTAEIIYDGVEAEELGRPSHGIANLIRTIIKASRIHVGLGACGNSRRAIMEASAYSKFRTAYGKNINAFPAYKSQLVELQILQSICTISNFRMVYHAEQNTKLQDLLIPLMKYKSSSLASYICKSAMLCLGGNGIIADFSPIPRLLNDSIINESWEGTHLIISDHCMHALSKDKVRKEWMEELSANIKSASSIQIFSDLIVFFHNLLTKWEALFSNSKQWKEANRIFIIDKTYEIFSLSLVIQEAASHYDEQSKIHFHYEHREEIYQDLAYAYKEILEFGVGAYKAPDGLFMNQEKLDRLLEYLS